MDIKAKVDDILAASEEEQSAILAALIGAISPSSIETALRRSPLNRLPDPVKMTIANRLGVSIISHRGQDNQFRPVTVPDYIMPILRELSRTAGMIEEACGQLVSLRSNRDAVLSLLGEAPFTAPGGLNERVTAPLRGFRHSLEKELRGARYPQRPATRRQDARAVAPVGASGVGQKPGRKRKKGSDAEQSGQQPVQSATQEAVASQESHTASGVESPQAFPPSSDAADAAVAAG